MSGFAAHSPPASVDATRTVAAGKAELIEFFPSRSSVPPQLWRSLIDSATESIDVLAFAGLFLPEVHDVMRIG